MSAKAINEILVLKGDSSEKQIDYTSLRKVALVLRAISHPLRKQLLHILGSEKEMIVTDLYSQLNIDQATVSQHLAILRRAGVLQTRKQGKFIYYSINSQKVSAINALVNQIGSLS